MVSGNPGKLIGLRYARSGSLHRIQVLLLLVALATLVLWLVGLAGRARNLARQLQANTVSDRLVLSTPSSVACCSSGVSQTSHPPHSIHPSLNFKPWFLNHSPRDFVGIPQKPKLGGFVIRVAYRADRKNPDT